MLGMSRSTHLFSRNKNFYNPLGSWLQLQKLSLYVSSPNRINDIPFLFRKNVSTSDVRCRLMHRVSSDTIFALSSGHGKCGVAVIRVSGSSAGKALIDLGKFSKLPAPRQAILRKLVDPSNGEVIDSGLVLWFPAPHSFTGEDCVEFQVHGGPAVLVSMVTVLSSIPGLRPAEAGEFTKRAFVNRKIDLTQVEGLGDLIHAETEAQRRQALRQMDGALSKLYTSWRQRIIKLTADLEAHIDFGEDELIEDGILDSVSQGVTDLLKEIKAHLQDNRQGERIRDGVHVTILGEPNVGKSSLLNYLCQRPAAIVSHLPGTTRDIVESAVNIGGYPVLLSDTAGLRETSDIVEEEGIKRAINRAKLSDIKKEIRKQLQHLGLLESTTCLESDPDLVCTDKEALHSPLTQKSDMNKHKAESEASLCDQTESMLTKESIDENLILVLNKSDLIEKSKSMLPVKFKDLEVCVISCRTEEGMENLVNVLTEKVKKLCGNPLMGNPSLTQVRHRNLLKECVRDLEEFSVYFHSDDEVLAAESLRKAVRNIGKITGKISSEDILDVIFRDFCIGK